MNIGSKVWVGADTFIFPGVFIKDNTVIGARSTITKSIMIEGIYAGNPCRLIGSRKNK